MTNAASTLPSGSPENQGCASLTLADHQIAAQWRGVRERVAEVQASRLRRLHRLLGDLATLAEDEDLDAADLRSRLHDLIAPFEAERRSTRVAESRRELGHRSQELARLLKTVRGAKLAVPTEHAVAAAFGTLDSLTASGSTLLPPATPQPFGPSWQGLIDQPDRVAALGCYRAATAMALKRGLRNGSITVAHSFSHRAAEDNLIAASLWQRSRARFIRALNLPAGPEPYLQRLEAGLTASLAILAKAAEAGAVAVEDGELRLPRRKPAPRDPRVDHARQALTLAVGNAQLPEVIIEVDHLTRFSWALLGRAARSERELVTVYASLIGLGSDLSAAELVRMVPGLAADGLSQMVLRIEADGRLRAANGAHGRRSRRHRCAAADRGALPTDSALPRGSHHVGRGEETHAPRDRQSGARA
jgi:hypothetical protein